MNKKIKEEIENYIKDNEEYKDFELEYILIDKNNKNNITAIAFKGEEIIEIGYSNREVKGVAGWAYNIDQDVFGELEENKKIVYMSMNMHYGIWETLKEWYPDDIENKKGMQMYLKYCKDNNISKKLIETETKLKDVSDIMQYYEKEKIAKKEKNIKER